MYLFVCALCMFINGVLAAGAKLKSIRYNTQYTVFENKLFIVIFCIGVFFGIGAYGVDKGTCRNNYNCNCGFCRWVCGFILYWQASSRII